MKSTVKRTLILTLSVLLTAVFSSCGKEDNASGVTKIRAATSGGPAPYISLDDNEKPVGYDIAVFEAVFDRLPQYELEWTVTSDYLTGILSGLYDVGVNNLAYRPERAESYYYTYPYKLTDKVFVQRADDEPLQDLADAASRGYKIELGASGLLNNVIENYNDANPDNQIEIIRIETDGFAIKYQHIIDGAADFTLDDSPIFTKVKEEYGLTDIAGFELTTDAMKEVMPSVYTYFLTAKDEAGLKLRDEINAVLKALRQDGTLSKLSVEYFGEDVIPPLDQYEETIN